MMAVTHATPGAARPAPIVRDRAPWAALIAAALVLRVALVFRAPIIEVDGAYWASLGAALARGDFAHGISTAWPPLYPALIAAAARLARALGAADGPALLEGCARAVSVVAGVALLVPLGALARRLLPKRAAWLALALAAFHPRLLQFSAAALSESIYTLLLTAGIALLVASDETRSDRREIAAGACFGLAFLTRPEGLPLAAALWAVGRLRAARQTPPAHDRARTERVPGLGPGSPIGPGALLALIARFRLGFAIATLAVALPYLLVLRADLGRWSLGEKGEYNFWRAYAGEYAALYPAPESLARRVNDSPELTHGLPSPPVRVAAFTLRRPGLVLGRSAAHLARIAGETLPVTVYAPVALLALIGLFTTRRRTWPVATTLIVVPILYAPLTVDRRFFVPLVPLLLLFAAAGWAWLEAVLSPRISDEARARRASSIAFATLLAIGVGYAFTRGARFDDAPEQRAAGEWLRGAWPPIRDTGPGASDARPVVMARKPWVAFYAEAAIAAMPDLPLDALIADARRRRVDLLVADQRSALADRPQLAPLLVPNGSPGGFAVIHREVKPLTLALVRLEGVAPR